MTDNAELKALAKEAAREAVKEMFVAMGVNLEDSDAIIKMQKDFQHVRESREGKEEFIQKGKTALMAVFITTSIALFMKGFWAELSANVAKVLGGN